MKNSAVLLSFVCCASLFGQSDPLSAPDMKKFAPHAVELGWKYFNKGDLDTAMKRFQIAIRQDPGFAPGYYGIAYIYGVQGKLDEAIRFYREVLRRDKSYPFTYANLGLALLEKGEENEALEMLDKALALDPKCGEAYLSYANYYADKQRWKDAETAANRAIEFGQRLDPEFVGILQQHGAKLSGPNQSTDPTLSSGTPAARQPARHP